MDERSKELLTWILAKDMTAISDSDRVFLKARRAYLTEEQRIKYGIDTNTLYPTKKKKVTK